MTVKKQKITPKQKIFVDQYIMLNNATQAALKAGYSEKTARYIAAENLSKPHIQLAIELTRQKLKSEFDLTPEKVIAEYVKLAFLDIRKAFDKDGRLKPLHEMDDATAAAIAGIEVEELYEGRGEARERTGRIHKIRLSDKKGALDSLGKHLGMFTDKVKATVDGGLQIQIIKSF